MPAITVLYAKPYFFAIYLFLSFFWIKTTTEFLYFISNYTILFSFFALFFNFDTELGDWFKTYNTVV